MRTIRVFETWDIEESKRLASAWENYYATVRLGGPAFGSPGKRGVPPQLADSSVS